MLEWRVGVEWESVIVKVMEGKQAPHTHQNKSGAKCFEELGSQRCRDRS